MQWGVIVWVQVLLWAWTVMPGSVEQQPQVRQSQSMSAAELEFIVQRKQVAVETLEKLGAGCTENSVPHIAIVASGGGHRAAVGLTGSLYQLAQEGLLDVVTYLGGNSGSAWGMSSLYSDPNWSANMSAALSRLLGPEISLFRSLDWLYERVEDEHFSLSDIWGLFCSAAIMKQLDRRKLSMDNKNALNPYPIYNTVNKNCLHQGRIRGRWFEMTPDESGFTDLGLFIKTSDIGSRVHDPDGKGPEMDMIQLHGLVGSALADTMEGHYTDWLKGLMDAATIVNGNILDIVLLWAGVPEQHSSAMEFLERLIRVRASLIKLTESLMQNTADVTASSTLQNILESLKAIDLFSAAFWKNKLEPRMFLLKGMWKSLEHHLKALLTTSTVVATQQQLQNLPEVNNILKYVKLIRNTTTNPAVVSMAGQLKTLVLDTVQEKTTNNTGFQMRSLGSGMYQRVQEDLQKNVYNWYQNLPLAPEVKKVTLFINKVLHLLAEWEWGTTENFLRNSPDADVPPCVRQKEHLNLVDAGFVLNTPYPPFLGPKRDIDLIIVLNYGAFETFETLNLAKQYAASMNKTFPEIPANVLTEKDWPRSCYVFEGKGTEATIVYMPLFNRDNSNDAWEIKAKRELFGTFQLPYSKAKIEYLLEVAKTNIKINTAGLVSEILKAADRRYNKS